MIGGASGGGEARSIAGMGSGPHGAGVSGGSKASGGCGDW